jgi:tRNA (cmo5U34)-methyltransferase
VSSQEAFFADPDFAARYTEGPPRFVPGHRDMLRMATMLLAEDAPLDAQVLVVGSGGGIELRHFSEAHAGWRLTGVDPSAQMLAVARSTLGPLAVRCDLIEGTVEAAPPGPFDAASCLLTLHMIPDDGSKLATLRAIRARLRPDAPFVIVDHCLDEADPQFERRLDRYARFALDSGAPSEDVARACEGIRQSVPMIARDREAELLVEAGFRETEIFYAGLLWTGWSARA